MLIFNYIFTFDSTIKGEEINCQVHTFSYFLIWTYMCLAFSFWIPYLFFNLCNCVNFSKYILMLLILHQSFVSDFLGTYPNLDNYLSPPTPPPLGTWWAISVISFNFYNVFSYDIFKFFSSAPLLFSTLWTLVIYPTTLSPFTYVIFFIISVSFCVICLCLFLTLAFPPTFEHCQLNFFFYHKRDIMLLF